MEPEKLITEKNVSEELKFRALGMINANRNLRDIVDELKISYPVLLKWKKELKEAKIEGQVQGLLSVPEVILAEVEEATTNTLELLGIDRSEAKKVFDGARGLQMLDQSLQTSALALASRIQAMSIAADNSKEIAVLVDSLAKLQTAFFNKGGTQVNILNNNGQTSSQTRFREHLRD